MYIILISKRRARRLRRRAIFDTVTKEIFRTFFIMILGFILISIALVTKYKPVYGVTIDGEVLGYVSDKEEFENTIQNEIIAKEGKNIESISLNEEPQYERKLISRSKDTNESEIISKLGKNTTTTYKFYVVTLNKKTKTYVDTLEEAEKVVKKIKSEYKGNHLKLDLAITEKYTQKLKEVKTDSVKEAKTSMEKEINKILAAEEAKKAIAAEKTKNVMAAVNGIKLSVLPVSGSISSRFGAQSSRRSGAHTGLDIACSHGTSIKAVAAGTVVFAQYNGSYGNLVKIDHGNGVETWYAHCSQILTKVGAKVNAGTVISKVGSTGNSTGPHLHLEVRIKGTPVNPQIYLYK